MTAPEHGGLPPDPFGPPDEAMALAAALAGRQPGDLLGFTLVVVGKDEKHEVVSSFTPHMRMWCLAQAMVLAAGDSCGGCAGDERPWMSRISKRRPE